MPCRVSAIRGHILCRDRPVECDRRLTERTAMDTRKEALFYETMADGRVQCSLCPHECTIGESKRGVCGVRLNHKGSSTPWFTTRSSPAMSTRLKRNRSSIFTPVRPVTRLPSWAAICGARSAKTERSRSCPKAGCPHVRRVIPKFPSRSVPQSRPMAIDALRFDGG
jgi:hypothetical protein